VLATIARRLEGEGRLTGVQIAEPVVERPPLAGLDGRVGSGTPTGAGGATSPAGVPVGR
jgi:hypothetical protein